MTDWQPTASIQTLQQRATLLRAIREFFHSRDVLEVETPALSHYGVTDVHLSNLTVSGPAGQESYLQTSPEYAMKRLLAAGAGSIYQLGKVFRDDESGRYHNTEFTLLEWYRIGFSAEQLMDEIEQLLGVLLACPTARRHTYQEIFQTYLGVDPLSQNALFELRKRLVEEPVVADLAVRETDLDTLLNLAMSVLIEPQLSNDHPVFITHFPVSQAALAKVDESDSRVAERFELYYRGIELANGFVELTDAETQRQRFTADNKQRQAHGQRSMALDERFLAALEAGLPACAGVAIGVDRLMMLALNKSHIHEVLAFPFPRA